MIAQLRVRVTDIHDSLSGHQSGTICVHSLTRSTHPSVEKNLYPPITTLVNLIDESHTAFKQSLLPRSSFDGSLRIPSFHPARNEMSETKGLDLYPSE